MASRYKFTEEEIADIEAACQESKNKRAQARLLALELRAKGLQSSEVAKATGFHAAYVTTLVAKYRKSGIEAIAGNHYGGNRRNMSLEQEKQILDPFMERVRQGERVTVREIEEAYQQAVDHPIGRSQIYAVLRRHGWDRSMLRSGRPRKSDEATEE